MARRNIQVFNMSFLDLMTDALGAVMILFLITPKGQSFAGVAQGKSPQGVVRFDTVAKKLWGDIAWGNVDSLRHKKGDTMAIIVGGFERMPSEKPSEPEPPTTPKYNNAHLADDEKIIKKSLYDELMRKIGSGLPAGMKAVPNDATILESYQVAVDKTKFAKMKEVNADETVCKTNQCNTRGGGGGGNNGSDKNGKMLCIGEASFQIAWNDISDDLDIFVKNNSGGEVSFKKESDPRVGKRLHLKTVFNQSYNIRNTEIVAQPKIIAGTYTISAVVYKSTKSSVDMFATVATLKEGKGLKAKSIPVDKQVHVIGQVTIDAAGNVIIQQQ